MTDGEWTERIWSFLRPFSQITKDQTIAHREDTLTAAVMYLAGKKNAVMGKLYFRFNFASLSTAEPLNATTSLTRTLLVDHKYTNIKLEKEMS